MENYKYAPIVIEGNYFSGNYSMFNDIYQNNLILERVLESIKSGTSLKLIPILFTDAFNHEDKSLLEMKYHKDIMTGEEKIKGWLNTFSNSINKFNVSKSEKIKIVIVTPHKSEEDDFMEMKVGKYQYKVNFYKFIWLKHKSEKLLQEVTKEINSMRNLNNDIVYKFIRENLKISAYDAYNKIKQKDKKDKMNLIKTIGDYHPPIEKTDLVEQMSMIIDDNDKLAICKVISESILKEEVDKVSVGDEKYNLTVSYLYHIVEVCFNLGFFENEYDLFKFKTRFRVPIELMIRDDQKGVFEYIIDDYQNEMVIFRHLCKIKEKYKNDKKNKDI